MRGWIVLSPDGVPITDRAYPTALHALGALADWCARFADQGYYAGVDGPIPVAELAERCRVIPPPRTPRTRTR